MPPPCLKQICMLKQIYFKNVISLQIRISVANTTFMFRWRNITFYFKYEKRTKSLTWEYEKRNLLLSKSGILVYIKLNKQFIFLFLCVLKGFCGKNPFFFNLSGFCAKIHRLGKFAKDSIALACYCTFWTFLIQRNKSGGSKYSLT